MRDSDPTPCIRVIWAARGAVCIAQHLTLRHSCRQCLDGGVHPGRRVFSPATVKAMTSDQNAAEGPVGTWVGVWALAHGMHLEISSPKTRSAMWEPPVRWRGRTRR